MFKNGPAPPCTGVDPRAPAAVDAAVLNSLESLPKAALIQALLRVGETGQQLTKESLQQLVKHCSATTQPSPQQGSSSSSDAHQDLPQLGMNTSGGIAGTLGPVSTVHPSLLQAQRVEPLMWRKQYSDEVDGYPSKRQRMDASPSECTTELQVSALQAPTEDLACGRRELPCPKDAEGTNSIALLKSNRTLRAAQAIQAMATGGPLVPSTAPAVHNGATGAASGPGASAGWQPPSKKAKAQHLAAPAGRVMPGQPSAPAGRQRLPAGQAPQPAAAVTADTAPAWQQQQQAVGQKKQIQQKRVMPHTNAVSPGHMSGAAPAAARQPPLPPPAAAAAVNYSIGQQRMPQAPPAAAAVPFSGPSVLRAPSLGPAAAAGLNYACPPVAAPPLLHPAATNNSMHEQMYPQMTESIQQQQQQLSMYSQPSPGGPLPVFPGTAMGMCQQQQAAAGMPLVPAGALAGGSNQPMQDFYTMPSRMTQPMPQWNPAGGAVAAGQFEAQLQDQLMPHCNGPVAAAVLGSSSMGMPASFPGASMSLSPSMSDLSGLDPASLDLMAAALAGSMGCGQLGQGGGNSGMNQLLRPGISDGYNLDLLDLLGVFADGECSSGSANSENMLALLQGLLQPGADGLGL